jgi:hypothetical protein
MTTDVNFQAPRLDGHGLGLGTGTKKLRKHGKTLAIILGALSFPL